MQHSRRVHISRLSLPDSCHKSREGIAGSDPVVSPTHRRYQQRSLGVIEGARCHLCKLGILHLIN